MAKIKTFEENMRRLEEIVDKLEKGDAQLSESLALFEEGTGLIKKCGEALDKAEQKVELLIKSQDGPVTAPFDGEDEQ